jgi:hypothetical protein
MNLSRGTIPKPTTPVEPKHDVSPAIQPKSHDHNLAIPDGVNLGFNMYGVGVFCLECELFRKKGFVAIKRFNNPIHFTVTLKDQFGIL